MNHVDQRVRSFSRDRISAALHEVGGAARPAYLEDIVAQAQRTRQRPAWTFPERWLPMSIAVRRAGIPRAVMLFALLLLLLALFAATISIVGSPKVPAPLVVTNGEIAFQGAGAIDVVSPDGTDRHTLVRLPGSADDKMIFSPDGRRLTYWSQPVPNENWDLTVVDADGKNPKKIGSGVVPSGWMDWSPDGTRIAYSARTARPGAATGCAGDGVQNGDFCSSRIFVAPVDGSGARQIGDSTLDARSPAWSPDGSKIAFGGGNATSGIRLYVMDADGRNGRQVGDIGGTDWAFMRVDWNHDGTKLVGQASATNNLSQWDMWEINADGSGATDVGDPTNGADDIIPSWAPDRDSAAWVAAHIMLKEPGRPTVSIPGPAGIPIWSPDGKELSTVDDAGQLVILGLDGSVRATVNGATGLPAWQPQVAGG
jgi:Tol biopolymer transport system component